MGRQLPDSRAERLPATVHTPSETAPDLWAQIVDELPMGLVYSDDGRAGVAANRFARDLLGLPSAGIAPRISTEDLERLGIQLNPARRAPPEPGVFNPVHVGGRRYTVTSFALKGTGPEGMVWLVREAAQAVEAYPIGALVPSIGHEFNNLLGRVICLAEEIQDHQDPQKIHDRAETLIEMAEHGAEVMRRLMTAVGCSRTMVADDLTPDAQMAMTRSLGR